MTIDQTRSPDAQVLQWILDGASEADVREAIKAHFPQENGEALIISAIRELQRDRPANLVLGWCHESARELYRKALELGDLPTALRAIKLTADLTKRSKPRANQTDSDGENAAGLQLLDVG